MKLLPARFVAVAAGLLVVCLAATADPPTADDGHEFVLLTEARPVLVSVHAQLDGKPVRVAWDDFVRYIFAYLDVDGDGMLSQAEVERAPTLEQILTGGLGRAFGFPAMGKGKAAPPATLADLDTDKDGRVSLAELGAYYRNSGFLPVQVQPDGGTGNPLAGLALYGGQRPEPTVEAVAEAMFALLDVNKDGKLTREELARAPAVLLARDDNDDEMIVPGEIAPSPKNTALAGMMAMGMGGGGSPAKGNKHLLLVTERGVAPPNLVQRLQEKYGAVPEDSGDRKAHAKRLGLDAATFARLDVNGDGVLDAAELAAFVKRPPDVTLTMRVGRVQGGTARVELSATKEPALRANKVHFTSGLAQLDLGRTRVDLVAQPSTYGADRIAGILRQQLLAQFRQADKDKNGYLDAREAAANRTFGGMFNAMDRDGDGKVYEAEAIAYFDRLADLQGRARAACVTLVLTDQSRGLFDLLDSDRDGRLSVREMRSAVKLLEQFDTGHKGYLERSDLPHSYRLSLRAGPASAGAAGPAAILELYRTPEREGGVPERTAGPLWFRKMDRNRDGDVSRKEFLGSDEQFRQIDRDGDGLISAAEAMQFDALNRLAQP